MLKLRTNIKNINYKKTIDKDLFEIKLDELNLPFSIPPAVETRFMARMEQIKFNRTIPFIVESLSEQIGDTFNISPKQVLLGNSLSEVKRNILYIFGGRGKSCIYPFTLAPFYDEYALLGECKPFHLEFNLKDYFSPQDIVIFSREKKANFVILSSPDILTGRVMKLSDLEEILNDLPDIPILVDETAVEFTKSDTSTLLKKYKNLLLLRTFTNAYGLSSMGISYILVGDEELAQKLKIIFKEEIVNNFSAMLADVAYQMSYEYEPLWNMINSEKKQLLDNLSQKYEIYPSAGNYFLLKVDEKMIDKIKLNKILVKTFLDNENLKDFIRITISTRIENDKLLKILTESDN